MWSSGPISHGHCSGKGWRETVMTRQPAAREPLHGRVADAARGAGQQENAAGARIGRSLTVGHATYPSTGISAAPSRGFRAAMNSSTAAT